MTGGEVMRCENSREAGAYLLGSLSPAERTSYERHLATCTICRETVAELAVLPGLLGRLDATAASRIGEGRIGDGGIVNGEIRGGEISESGIVDGWKAADESDSRLSSLIEAATKSHRRDARTRRWRLVGAAAAAAGVAALASLGLAPGSRQAPPAVGATVAMTEMTQLGGGAPVTGEVGLVRITGGTEVRVRCEYAGSQERGQYAYTYRLVAVGDDGTRDQVGSWRAGPGSDMTLSGVTHLSYQDIDRLELQRGGGDPLLVYYVR